MAQSIWQKLGMNPLSQTGLGHAEPQIAMAPSPFTDEAWQEIQMKEQAKEDPKPRLRELASRRPPPAHTLVPQQEAEPGTQSMLQEMLKERLGGIKGMQTQIEEIQANPTSTSFRDADLRPLLAWADRLGGTNTAQYYKPPESVTDEEKIAKLRDAIAKEKAGVTDDFLALMNSENQMASQADLRDFRNKQLKLQEQGLEIDRLKALNPKAKPPTASQWQAATYGKRMEDATKVIDRLRDQGYDMTTLSSVAERTNWSPNLIRDPAARQALQAQINFVNAVLRRESGAVIADSEFKNTYRQYFPSHGDDPDTLAQKDFNRARSIEGLRLESGDAWNAFSEDPRTLIGKSAPQNAQESKPQIAPKIGQVEDGYQYLGGNPEDPKSWRQVR